MEIMEFIKIWGMPGVFVFVSLYLGKFFLDKFEADITAKMQLAAALLALTDAIKSRHEMFEKIEKSFDRVERVLEGCEGRRNV